MRGGGGGGCRIGNGGGGLVDFAWSAPGSGDEGEIVGDEKGEGVGFGHLLPWRAEESCGLGSDGYRDCWKCWQCKTHQTMPVYSFALLEHYIIGFEEAGSRRKRSSGCGGRGGAVSSVGRVNWRLRNS